MKRDLKNRMLFGVCSGIAREYDADPNIIRLLFVFLTMMVFGLPIVIYTVAAILMEAD